MHREYMVCIENGKMCHSYRFPPIQPFILPGLSGSSRKLLTTMIPSNHKREKRRKQLRRKTHLFVVVSLRGLRGELSLYKGLNSSELLVREVWRSAAPLSFAEIASRGANVLHLKRNETCMPGHLSWARRNK